MVDQIKLLKIDKINQKPKQAFPFHSKQRILVPSAYHIKLHSSKEDFEHPNTFEKTIQRYSNHEYIIKEMEI
jgi:hypothetical protein